MYFSIRRFLAIHIIGRGRDPRIFFATTKCNLVCSSIQCSYVFSFSLARLVAVALGGNSATAASRSSQSSTRIGPNSHFTETLSVTTATSPSECNSLCAHLSAASRITRKSAIRVPPEARQSAAASHQAQARSTRSSLTDWKRRDHHRQDGTRVWRSGSGSRRRPTLR